LKGWYSERLASIYGSEVWARPDGSEVEITTTCPTVATDAVDCGTVVAPVRAGRPQAPDFDEYLAMMVKRAGERLAVGSGSCWSTCAT
jgi:hypothetical protein